MTAEQTHEQALKGLYAITDENLIAEDKFEQTIELALLGSARIIQYRDKSGNEEKRYKQASTLRSLCDRYNAVLIINDDVTLAHRVKADGVHLGKNDDSISQARQILGDKSIIGISCYNDINLAIAAEKNMADYVAFGAMFSSSTKPDAKNADLDIVSEAKQKLNIPVCTIGGITENNIKQLIDHGTDMAAVIYHLFSADDIKLTATRLNKNFK